MGAIHVLIVDDSAVVRQTLRGVLGVDGDIVVQAAAGDPFEAAKQIAIRVPDVMILDFEMPRMDGLTFLRKVMHQYPIPTILCSTKATVGSNVVFEAMRAGAVDVVLKPTNPSESGAFGGLLRDAVRGAVGALVHQPRNSVELRSAAYRAASAKWVAAHPVGVPSVNLPCGTPLQAIRAAPVSEQAAPVPAGRVHDTFAHQVGRHPRSPSLIVIGASTGGTEAIRRVLGALPADMPPIFVVQHMPPGFTASFASWLDACCALSVSEASDGMRVDAGQVVIARGGEHLRLQAHGGQLYVSLGADLPVNRHRPSVDALFDSVPDDLGARTLAVLLTGMGDDGANGLLRLRQRGAYTVAESKETAVVFGMPKEAIDRGGACQVLPLHDIHSLLATSRREPNA